MRSFSHDDEKTGLLANKQHGFQNYGLGSEAEDGCDALGSQPEQRHEEPTTCCQLRTHFRFFVLFWIAMISFGGHLCRASMSTFQIYFQEDPTLGIGATHYGVLISAAALPNLFLPLFGGTLFDTQDHKVTTIVFLFVALIGQIIFATGITIKSFWLALLGVFIFGTGNGSSIVAERAIISQQFKGKEVTFALGASVATSALSKFVGRAMVAPVADAFDNYLVALWGTCLFIILSIICAVIYNVLSVWEQSQRREGVEEEEEEEDEVIEQALLEEPIDEEAEAAEDETTLSAKQLARKQKTSMTFSTLTTQAWELPIAFWFMAYIHTIYHIMYRMFINFSASYIREKWHTTVSQAGYISSLVTVTVVFAAPLSGFIMDWVGGRLYIMMVAGMITVLAFGLLAFSDTTPVVGVVLLSFSESFIPTISMALIPEVTPSQCFGIAFGVIEVLNAISNLSGNMFMGWMRDATDSYEAGMNCVFVLAMFGCLSLMALFLWDRTINDNTLNTSQLRMKYQSLGDAAVISQTPAVLAIEAPIRMAEFEGAANRRNFDHKGRPRRCSV